MKQQFSVLLVIVLVLLLFSLCACNGPSDADRPDRSSENNSTGIFLIVVGVFNAAFPKATWYIGEGWKFKKAEPSEQALEMSRAAGIVAIIVGVIMLLS